MARKSEEMTQRGDVRQTMSHERAFVQKVIRDKININNSIMKVAGIPMHLDRQKDDKKDLTQFRLMWYVRLMKRKSSKREYLKLARAWNERARLVDSSLFKQNDFFDPRDTRSAEWVADEQNRIVVGPTQRPCAAVN